jgi:hypothetical protein
MMKKIFIVALMICSLGLWAQSNESLIDLNQHRLDINRTGMIILGSWAVGNMAMGAAGYYNSTGEAKYFHQMNLMWNVVNAGIAGFGLHSALNGPADLGFTESIREHESIRRILLFNAGLDVGYMATGLYLRERSFRSDNPERFRGFGNSLLLQGAFLFTFDLIMFSVHGNMSDSLYNLEISPMGLIYRF